jgi:general secretion pathway protein D
MNKNLRFSSLFSRMLIASVLVVAGGNLTAQDVHKIAEREVARRQHEIGKGEAALSQGRAAMESKDFARAHAAYRTAIDLLPDAVATSRAHDEAVRGFCESGVKLAEQRLAENKSAEAEQIAREILTDRYDPRCHAAQAFLERLHDPHNVNRTMGPKFVAKVEEVRALLSDADGYYNSGRYDLAFKKYEQVLNLDPYNVAARRGQERIDVTKTRYGEEAYNETRGRQLWQVQKGWEEPVRQYGRNVSPIAEAFSKDVTGTARITNKLNLIIIPKVEFRDASVREAIDFLRQQAAANDPAAEGRKGVDIVLRLAPVGRPAGAAPAAESAPPLPGASPEATVRATPAPANAPPGVSPADARITITLDEIPLGEALRYIANQAGLKVKVEPYAVLIIPISEQSNDLLTKEYRVPPGFISGTLNPCI